jgi:hypothetical protein
MDKEARKKLYTEELYGEVIGRAPRKMEISELNALGHERQPLLKVIREKCVDCSQTESEARKCTAIDCVLWPYRMRKNPFSENKGNPDALAAARAARAAIVDGCESEEMAA